MNRPTLSPYLLLVLTTLFWSGNFVLARYVRLDVPPIGLSFWRWAVAGMILLPIAWPSMRRAWPMVQAHLPLVCGLALLGITLFNTLVYLGLQSTTASNAVLLQSVIPVIIIALARLVLGTPVQWRQLLGILLSLGGVVAIITQGELAVLLGLGISRGDLWVLAAVIVWGLYSVLLKKLPPELAGVPLLGYTVTLGVIGIFPLYIAEMISGSPTPFSMVTVGSVAYVALFPSLLAYYFWNLAVAQVGPNRSGQFIHLIPVFGTLLSILFLGEQLHLYHLIGIILVACGIYLATVQR